MRVSTAIAQGVCGIVVEAAIPMETSLGNRRPAIQAYRGSLFSLANLTRVRKESRKRGMGRHRKISYISIPAEMVSSLPATSMTSLLIAHRKAPKHLSKLCGFANNAYFWLALIILCAFVSTFKFFLTYRLWKCDCSASSPFVDSKGCWIPSVQPKEKFSDLYSLAPLQDVLDANLSDQEREFWRQPQGLGYSPCIRFSAGYRKKSRTIANERGKYVVVAVSGGLNQQRSQIVDAVVIARILEAALVVPILQVNVVWNDESEFSDIFDVEHFKHTLKDDVRVVNSLPSTHLMNRPEEEKITPLHVSPAWIRTRYLKHLRSEGIVILRGLDARLSKDLPPDLLKLRCKVAFHALRFAEPIQKVGNLLAERMREGGPYLALHLRLEKDVWVRTGCLPGLSSRYNQIVRQARKSQPMLLTGRSNMTYHERKLGGFCPLNAMEVARLLKALGAPRNSRIYWAGGEPLGGKEALQPLVNQFPNLYNKQTLALPGELDSFGERASALAAIDYIVSMNSNVFMPSHGGNMGHALRGHRAYAGHRKHITPDKRQMLPYFLDTTLSEQNFSRKIQQLHEKSLGQPELRTLRPGRDCVTYPVPNCMCRKQSPPPKQ